MIFTYFPPPETEFINLSPNYANILPKEAGGEGVYQPHPKFLLKILSSGGFHDCEWRNAFEAELNQLTKLKQNWDGEGGIPISRSVVSTAMRVMETIYLSDLRYKPAIVPGRNGNFQLEWTAGNVHIELVFFDERRIVAAFWDLSKSVSDPGRRTYKKLLSESDYREVKNWVKKLTPFMWTS